MLGDLGRRIKAMQTEASKHEKAIIAISNSWRPDLLDEQGVGPIVAATILCAWSHAGRFRDEAAFASLAGVAPIPASSGMTTRHRLNPCGDRQLNRALHVVVLCRLRYDPATRGYAERLRAEGKTDREIKRYVSRLVSKDGSDFVEIHLTSEPPAGSDRWVILLNGRVITRTSQVQGAVMAVNTVPFIEPGNAVSVSVRAETDSRDLVAESAAVTLREGWSWADGSVCE